ncbi:MAG: ubiquinol-cytochrome c reductase iron-sulfur subunit [Planctomycetota bacterium]|jgi:cytochrome b6-f complex iron-sulfur subunit
MAEVEKTEVTASTWTSRRGFFTYAGWTIFLGTTLAFLAKTFSFTGFFFPKVLFEPSKKFPVGYPADFPDHSVVTLKARRVFIVREGNNFSAISMVCQHLGCAVHWTEEKGIYECPCHGSKYYKDGVNFAGPAPRPLFHFDMHLSDDGKLMVDTSTIVERVTMLTI